jgi:hypothetical protein
VAAIIAGLLATSRGTDDGQRLRRDEWSRLRDYHSVPGRGNSTSQAATIRRCPQFPLNPSAPLSASNLLNRRSPRRTQEWPMITMHTGGRGWSSLANAAAMLLVLLPHAAFGQAAPSVDPASVPLSARESSAVVLSLAEVLRERFAFHERGIIAAREIEAMEKRGAFREARTAAELLTLIDTQISPIVDDRHFRTRYWGPEAVAGFTDAPPSAEEVTAFHEEVRLRGGEIPEVRWLAGNVGYVRIRMFLDAAPSSEKLATALTLLADTSALIVDVRGSPGGEPAGVANVIGHLVGERTATVRTQGGAKRSDEKTFFAEPRTPSFSHKPIYVLTDGKTASGAEEFAYDLQAIRRATLVGETTRGAATPGGYRPLAHGFVAFIPMQIVANAVTGSNWEGVGVSPDIKVPAEEALVRAHRLALEAVVENAQGVRRAIAEEGLASLQPAKQQ